MPIYKYNFAEHELDRLIHFGVDLAESIERLEDGEVEAALGLLKVVRDAMLAHEDTLFQWAHDYEEEFTSR